MTDNQHDSSTPSQPVSLVASGESTPSESTPSESTPSESTPSESTPSESTPSESTPSESTRQKREKLPQGSWGGILRRTFRGFSQDKLSDSAAALTYYGVLSIFPGLLVLVSALRIFGAGTSNAMIRNIEALAPGQAGKTINNAIVEIQKGSHGTATLLAVVSIVGALWAASGYVGAFMRAANTIYDVPEGRPFWKLIPVRLVLTVFTGVILAAAALSVILTGKLAKAVGDAIGVGDTAVTVWSIAKWPVLLVIVSLLFSMLYWASPNARVGRFRFFHAGSLAAVVIWIVASLAFGYYVANFGSYNRIYGSLAAVIVFLIWLWVSNLALLFGAELDSEIQRSRAVAAGHSPEHEPYLPLRDTSKLPKTV